MISNTALLFLFGMHAAIIYLALNHTHQVLYICKSYVLSGPKKRYPCLNFAITS